MIKKAQQKEKIYTSCHRARGRSPLYLRTNTQRDRQPFTLAFTLNTHCFGRTDTGRTSLQWGDAFVTEPGNETTLPSVPVNKGFDHCDADYKEHEHREGHHGAAQQDGAVLPDACTWHLCPNPLLSVPVSSSASIAVLSHHSVAEFPGPHTHRHTHIQGFNSEVIQT